MYYNEKDLGRIISLVSVAGEIKGRTKFQKMVYILQCKGAEFESGFRYHYYGPYSLDLQITIDSLAKNGLIREEHVPNDSSYVYSSVPDVVDNETMTGFKDLISLLNGTSSQILELVGTIFFLRREENITDKEIISAKLKFLKPHLEGYIETAFELYNQINDMK